MRKVPPDPPPTRILPVDAALPTGKPIAGETPSLGDEPTRLVDPAHGPPTVDPFLTSEKEGEPAPAAPLPVFEGFDILGEIGRGGMGVVYRACDRRTGQIVALKTMQHPDAGAIRRFKDEFRILTDLVHPNLVALYEMYSGGVLGYFTMEFLEAVDFIKHVRAGVTAEWTPERERRLRAAFVQLATGVQAIHDAGRIHRDLKPSNVLVTRAERVVILDFGLAAHLSPTGLHHGDRHVMGTIPYMSPEQAIGVTLSAATDWYSVGVILFEALTGRLPYHSRGLDVLEEKVRQDVPSTRSIAPEVPAEWDQLCLALLRRDPLWRLGGADLLRRWGGGLAVRQSPAPTAHFIGREAHLASLDAALARVRSGRAAVVLLAGRSGAGKSTLTQHFLDRVRRSGDALVLSGQCYQQEAVPYKAFDSLIDALSRYLCQMEAPEVRALLPRYVDALARLFPVLGPVAELAALHRGADLPDPQEQRRRAFVALRELLARLSDRQPLVLSLDDLQWADADSLALLLDLLRPPDPPLLLLIASFRSEDADSSPFLKGLLNARAELREAAELCEITLEPLTPEQATDLALALLERDDADTRALAELIARESGGNPFYVQELARQARGATDAAEVLPSAQAMTLDAVLWRRIEQLPPNARRLVTLLAVAGRPVDQATACQAADLAAEQMPTLTLLRGQRLIRGTGMKAEDLVATYHDRIRETITARLLPDEARQCHRRLASALEATGRGDPDRLAVHLHGAGDDERAATQYALAADLAAGALAFDRAARHYRLALDLGRHDTRTRAQLQEKLANALANAGRGAEAARAYLAAAEGADADAVIDLRRRACGQYLRSGHIAEGVGAARSVLDQVGLHWPATPARAVASLLISRLRLWIRGLKFVERPAEQCTSLQLRRIGATWSIATGLASLDVVRGAYFQAQNVLEALAVGEPVRVARALCLEASHRATVGRSAEAQVARVLAEAERLVRRLERPYLTALFTMARGITSFLFGRWSDAHHLCTEAELIFRDQCQGVAWERDTSQTFGLYALLFTGQLAALDRTCAQVMQEARDRGDLFALAHLGTFMQPLLRLTADQPGEADDELERVLDIWPRSEFHIQHANALLRKCEILLYQGDAAQAAARCDQAWLTYQRSQLLRIQHMRMNAVHLRGRVALAHAAQDRAAAERRQASAARCARQLLREGRADAIGLGHLLRAALADQHGRIAEATQELSVAMAALEVAGLRLFAEAARRQLGRLTGGDSGRELIATADRTLAAEGVRNPERFAAVLAPGFTRS